MAYTTINKSTDYFTTTTWSGSGSQQTISLPFQADWIWVKRRNGTANHAAQDIVNGFGNRISPNRDVALGSEPNGIGTVSGSGINFQGDYAGSGYNESGGTYVSWNWKAANSQGSSNTDGSINTTYTSVNTTAGFSISKYTGNGSAGATVGHGLGVVPGLIFIKNLSSATTDWGVYHKSLGGTKALFLNLTAQADTNIKYFNNTDPTNQVFSLGTYNDENANGENYIAYCFAEKTGYSKFGSYTGNGNADGTFVYTGFKPAWVMAKRTDSSSSGAWVMWDNKRSPFNSRDEYLVANDSATEGSSGTAIEIFSNGWKPKAAGACNISGGSFVYMAFAEAPIVGSNNVPATAS